MTQAPQLTSTIPFLSFKIVQMETLSPALGGTAGQGSWYNQWNFEIFAGIYCSPREQNYTCIQPQYNIFSQGWQAVYRGWVRIAFLQIHSFIHLFCH